MHPSSRPDDFSRVLDACPDTHVILEHLAGVGIAEPPYADYVKALHQGERDNTSIKIPGLGEICARPPRLLPKLEFDHVPPLFEMAKDAFGVQRMMWGSDFPPSAGREGYANTLPGLGEIWERLPARENPSLWERLLPELEFDHVPPLFEMAKDAFGVQRMMWGSDFPPSAGREGYANTLRGVINHPAFADGDDIEWVMGKTAARVWGF